MTGYLNFGGDGGAMVRTQPARVLDTTWTISTARPALVVYSVQIASGAGGEGSVTLRCGGVTVATFQAVLAPTTYGFGTLTALVLPGEQVTLVTAILAGVSSFALVATTETVL